MGTKSASSIAVHEVLTEDKTEENNPEVPDSQSLINSGKDINGKNAHFEEFWKHLKSGDWDKIKEILEKHPKMLGKNITALNKKALHMAVFAGQKKIVENLVDLMEDKDLRRRDKYGYTALAEATLHGNYEMAECLLNKDMGLISIPSYNNKLLPVVLAVFHKHLKLARYLYRRTPLKDLLEENGPSGVTLIIQVMYTEDFDIALDLIKREPSLAFAQEKEKWSPYKKKEKCSPLSALASMPRAFKSSKLAFWKEWIYESIRVELPPNVTTNETCLNIPEGHESNGAKNVGLVPEPLRQPVPCLYELLGIQGLHKMKRNDMYSREILRLMCEKISPLNEKEQNDVIYVAIFRAIKEGFKEFVSEVLNANPYLIWARDNKGATVFHQAVLYREAEIFKLLHEHPVKNSVMNLKDNSNNNVLHMAGKSTPSPRFKCIRGAVLQMQKELQWFKELEDIVHPNMKEERNNDGLTPQELFTKEHEGMKNKGEEWMKNTATSCSVVAALIVTIMFAAAFTVPGGNDQNTGLPTFLNKKLFMLFIVSDALSLFSSSTSVLMFLGILTSRYAEEDFHVYLPLKMIIGLYVLFFSIATMMIAFSSALFLMLHGQSWIFRPVICFASVPVTLFAFMQFPLLHDMSKSTCGHSIFPPRMKNWLEPIHSGINDEGCPVNNWHTSQN